PFDNVGVIGMLLLQLVQRLIAGLHIADNSPRDLGSVRAWQFRIASEKQDFSPILRMPQIDSRLDPRCGIAWRKLVVAGNRKRQRAYCKKEHTCSRFHELHLPFSK